jgi:D-alanyl-D-alanine carboxypeptidase (penicillin-binding protein 5/6)
MKTGYTRASGFCLIASGEKDGLNRIVVILGSTSISVWKDAQELLEWALRA